MFLKQCIVCDKEFETMDKRVKICSDECKRERRNQQARERLDEKIAEKQTERICLHCGNQFTPVGRYNIDRAKFCSRKCRQNYRNKERWAKIAPPDPEPRDCIICGKNFVPPRKAPHAQTCSQGCNIRNQQNREIEERKAIREEVLSEPRVCKNCGENFIPNTPTQVHCSEECRYESTKSTKRDVLRKIPLSVKSKWEKKRRWRGNWLKAIERDNYKCQFCGSEEKINVHHLDCKGERRINRKRVKDRNDSLDNLITLCEKCHKEIHGVFVVKTLDGWSVMGKVFNKLGLSGTIKILDIEN